MGATLSSIKNNGFFEFRSVAAPSAVSNNFPLIPIQGTVETLAVSNSSIAGYTRTAASVWATSATSIAGMNTYHGTIAKINDSTGWIVSKNTAGTTVKLSKINFLTGAITDTVTLASSPDPTLALGIGLKLNATSFYQSTAPIILELLGNGNLRLRQTTLGGYVWEFTTSGANVSQTTVSFAGNIIFDDSHGVYYAVDLTREDAGGIVSCYDSLNYLKRFNFKLGEVDPFATGGFQLFEFGDLIVFNASTASYAKAILKRDFSNILRRGILQCGGVIE